MKFFKIIFLFIAITTTGIAISSCGNNSSSKTEKQSKEYSSAYICPMHCEGSGSDKEGKCPVCGMDYVKNENHKAEGKNEESHDGHDHDDQEGHNH